MQQLIEIQLIAIIRSCSQLLVAVAYVSISIIIA